MNFEDYLSEDGRAVVALCSQLGLTGAGAVPDTPLTLSEWNELEQKLSRGALKRAAALEGLSAEELAKETTLDLDQAERAWRLLNRSGQLAFELESLFSRGIWATTRVDKSYPSRLLRSLKQHAPAVLFGAGEINLLQKPSIAVIGSRNIDERGAAFAREAGSKASRCRAAVVSGGARRTDRIAMDGSLEAGGTAVGALADSLESTLRKSDVRELLLEHQLALVTPYAPSAGFSVGAAMGRNKIIYGLADFAIVVSSDHQSGGTWAGAVEALKNRWCAVYVRDAEEVPKGNRELLRMGAISLPEVEFAAIGDLIEWLESHAVGKPIEQDLFNFDSR